MKNKSLLALNFNIACNDYVKALCKMYDFDYDEAYWIGDEVGGILDINEGEYVFGLLEIIYIVDNNIEYETFDAWYTYTLRLSMIDANIPLPNLKSWCKGCPRKTKEELAELERLHNNVINAKELLQDYIDKDNGQPPTS